jgi:hypothetical protein
MNSIDFDRVIHTLSASPSRRAAVRGLVAGSLIALMGLNNAEAKKRKRKRKRRKKHCTCPAGSGKICQGGTCVCPVGQEDSGGVCGVPPTCGGWMDFCIGPLTCCSLTCDVGFLQCAKSEDGAPCHSTDDCAEPGSVCRGFVCVGP